MSSNIYNISNWVGSTSYKKNDIVIYSNLYYYAASDHNSHATLFDNDLNNGKWYGYHQHNGESKPYFAWIPAYSYTVDNQPRIKKIQLGDGYIQRVPDGISNILPSFNLEFESDLSEATAILHFLATRVGTESFVWLPPAPYGVISRWICEQWTNVQPFYDNYKIQCKFERSVV